METNKVLHLIYTAFVGILLALFVGVGINTFYQAPEAPKYPSELTIYKEPTAEQAVQLRAYDKKNEAYRETLKPYNRNVSMLALGAGVICLSIALIFGSRIKVAADGVMLGGLFSLLYSIGRGFASENSKYVFLLVSISLVIVLFLGYRRFASALGGPKKPSSL